MAKGHSTLTKKACKFTGVTPSQNSISLSIYIYIYEAGMAMKKYQALDLRHQILQACIHIYIYICIC